MIQFLFGFCFCLTDSKLLQLKEMKRNRTYNMQIWTKTQLFLVVVVLIGLVFNGVSGHGRLVDPPGRSSMWRYGFSNPPNYNDNQLYCGGVQIQYEVNKGRCGVCGDPFQGPHDNEPGGKYAAGIIVRTYKPGEVIEVAVEITAPHKGYMEFRLCPNDDPNVRITQECLDNYILPIVESRDTKYPVTKAGKYVMRVSLPPLVRCRDCVFQWKYNTGNSWGVDPITQKGCVGCGNQEQFYGCADISIGHDDIQEGLSLITNQISKGRPVVEPGVPTPPMVTPDPDEWENTDDKDNGVIESKVDKTDSSYQFYKNFMEFQKQFPNENIRPCVCHSCVENTCVCECLSNSIDSYFIPNFTLLFLALASSLLSCLGCMSQI